MMPRVVASLAGGLIVGALIAGCTAPAPLPTSTPTLTPSAAPLGDGILRIGTLVPTTGTFAFIGAAQAAGVDLAVKEINESGGFEGAPVELVQRDSGDATTATAEASFADLVTQITDVVIGPSSSVLAQRLIPLAAQERIPLISPAATFPALTSQPGAD